MILVKLQGGLGNQMFQYAAAKRLALKNKTELKLDLSFLEDRSYTPDFTYRNFELDIFDIKYDIATKPDIHQFKPDTRLRNFQNLLLNIFQPHSNYVEPLLAFNTAVLSLPRHTYLEGYFQSEKYFEEIKSIIREEFKIKHKPTGKIPEISKAIFNSNSVSIHLRRGDYVTNWKTNQVHGICSEEYYNQAINQMKTKLSNPYFYIFSDDPDWVINNFIPDAPYICIDSKKGNSYDDIRLMSLCKHNIIANSSFSWWGAWLNENPDKIVIAPVNWFNDPYMNAQTSDLIPNKWIRL